MSSALKRLASEWREIVKASRTSRGGRTGPPEGAADDGAEIILFPRDADDVFDWTAYIVGPPDTPYAGARFQLRVKVPKSYPLAPPDMKFVTRVCHPNVHFKNGGICLDILKEAWTPVWSLESACRAVIALLASPDVESPLNCDAGNLIRAGDEVGFRALARMYVLDCAQLLRNAGDDDGSDEKDKDA